METSQVGQPHQLPPPIEPHEMTRDEGDPNHRVPPWGFCSTCRTWDRQEAPVNPWHRPRPVMPADAIRHLTADDIRQAVLALPDTYRPHVHLVSRHYADYRLALTAEECEVKVYCADCFMPLWLTKRR